MVEDSFCNLLSKNYVEVKVDRSPWGEDKIVVFRRQLENLLQLTVTMPLIMLQVNVPLSRRYECGSKETVSSDYFT